MKIFKPALSAAVIFALSTFGSLPVSAQNANNALAIVSEPFSVDGSGNIPKGSTILHLDGGVTEVVGPDNRLIEWASDADAKIIPTPSGLKRATWLFQVPSGSRIDHEGLLTNVFDDGTKILTVIDQTTNKQINSPSFTGWMEDANYTTTGTLDLFTANWNCPSAPPNPNLYSVLDYIFNGITDAGYSKIIQPVLEWDYNGSANWTGAAWDYAYGGSGFRATAINVSTTDTLNGTMKWITTGWQVSILDGATSKNSSLDTNLINTDQNLAVDATLEGYNITGNGDVPGMPYFDKMSFSPSLSFTWNTWNLPTPPSPVTGLGVYVYSQSKLVLETPNP